MADYSSTLPFTRGETYFGSNTPSTTDFESGLGGVFKVIDKDQVNSRNTSREVNLMVVRNEHGATLSGGDPVKWAANRHGLAVVKASDPAEAVGWVDDVYAGTIADDDIFFMVMADGHSPVTRYGQTDQLIPHVHREVYGKLTTYGPFDDFDSFVSGFPWTVTGDGSFTHVINDEVGGVLKLTTDTSDENEVIIHTEGEVFKFADDKPISFGARVKITEGATDKASVLVGLVSGAVASAIGDAGAGPPSSYSGACFFKNGGGTVWQAETSLAGTQSTDTDCGTATSGTYFVLHCDVFPTSSTSATAKFYIDGTLVHTSTFTYTSATEMRFMIGVHASTASAEVLDVDWAYCKQVR